MTLTEIKPPRDYAPPDKRVPCHSCGWLIAKYAPRCPSCGQRDPGGNGGIRGDRAFIVLIGFVVAIYVISKYFPQLLN